MDKVKELIRRWREHSCPSCLQAVYDVTAPACPVGVAMGREAREAVRKLSRRTGRPTWDIEHEAQREFQE